MRIWVLVALFVAGHGTPASAAAVPAEDTFGVNLGSVLNLAPAERERQLEAIAAAGIHVVREDAAWGGAEQVAPDSLTGEHRYDWSSYDFVAGTLASHGLRWFPILDYSTSWSGRVVGDFFSPPNDPSAFAAYAKAFASRYGRGGSFWAEHPELPLLPVWSYEIWNEPNSAHFWHPQDRAPEDYADLYLVTREAIHQTDAHAEVVVGGLLEANAATAPRTFLRRMLDHRPDAIHQIDAVGYHPYLFTADRDLEATRRMCQAMASFGMRGTPLAITEIGQARSSVSAATRAEIIGGLAERFLRAGLGVVHYMPYAWMTAPAAGNDEDEYGLVRADGGLDAAGAAYADAIKAASAGRSVTAEPTSTDTCGTDSGRRGERDIGQASRATRRRRSGAKARARTSSRQHSHGHRRRWTRPI